MQKKAMTPEEGGRLGRGGCGAVRCGAVQVPNSNFSTSMLQMESNGSLLQDLDCIMMSS